MDRETRNAAVAAFVILLVFGAFAYWLPTLMMAAGNVSGWLAGVVAAVFLLGLFIVFWLRGRSQRKG
ncbi:hypothetical protein ABMA46_07940 [Mesorhizobium sp. CN5-321]|jgi:hypothetical protein|uniref:hypothetical protein n=1 Tax=Mesorhizobium hunchu TaxID=3157708 RepID=UPI0032B749D9